MNQLRILTAILVSLWLLGCTKEITLDLPEGEEKIVVQGTIETGAPPFVLLNRNYPFFGEFTAADFSNGFIRDAEVTVSDGTNTVTLEELCWTELTDAQRILVEAALGASLPDSIPADFDFCVYTLLQFPPTMVGEFGKTYMLNIRTTDQKELFATTTIPHPVYLDSIWMERHNNTDLNYVNYRRLYVRYKDPDTLGNFYRYYTRRNSGPLLPVGEFDDMTINGKEFFFPITRAYSAAEEQDINFDTYGYYEYGDTAQLKWATIDKATFDFWRTLGYSESNSGPFGGNSKVISNVQGGIGVWGGYGISNDTTIYIE